MLIVTVFSAEVARTPRALKRAVSTSPTVYLPRFLRGSATSSRTTRYATRKPIDR